MRWLAKAALQRGLGTLPQGERLNYVFQRRVLRSLPAGDPALRRKFSRALQHLGVYRERSPANHVDRLASALILFQGAEDEAVPPSQAEAMYAAVKAKGLPVAYLRFEGEQHGFRQARNIRRALEAELAFYGRVLGFEPADAIEAVEIQNPPPDRP